MFDPQAQDRPLPSRIRRMVVIGLVALLLVVGLFSTVKEWLTGDNETPPEDAAPQTQDETPGAPQAQDTPDPTPGASTAEVDGWFLYSPAEYARAGSSAEEFLSAVATIDFTDGGDFTDHADQLGEHATDNEAAKLATSHGVAEGIWRVLGGKDEDVWEGQAEVSRVWYFDEEAIHIILDLTAVPASGEGPTGLGEFRVVMVESGGGWEVDFAEMYSPE